MRYKLSFKLENDIFPIQYHRCILSFIKYSLLNYNEKYYKKLYNEKDNIIKPYTFSVYFNLPKFNFDHIILSSKQFDLYFSVEDYELSIILYNSFNNQMSKNFSINKNSITLYNISLIPEKDVCNNITIKFMSPLVVRDRNQQERKDYYYAYDHEKFKDILKINIKEQLKITNINIKLVDTFNIDPIKPKKTVVKFYEKQIECSLGIYRLTGDSDLLEYLYKAGIGSKHSSGFGMFTIV